MEVKVLLHGILRDYLPRPARGRTTLDLPEGTLVAEVLEQLGIQQTVSAAVNGLQVETTHPLHDGDDLQLFRMIGGG